MGVIVGLLLGPCDVGAGDTCDVGADDNRVPDDGC